MNTNSGDYGLLAHAFSFHWLIAVNNVISYDDEFSNSHDGFHNVFTIHLLFLPLDHMLESGGMRGKFGQ